MTQPPVNAPLDRFSLPVIVAGGIVMEDEAMDQKQLLELEEFARRISREAGDITLDYFETEMAVETKCDNSPVTIADKKAEENLRRNLEKAFPDHSILGEEFGETNPGAEYRWILDPIDGTRSFIAGVPQYTVLVALEYRKEAVVGVVHSPALNRTMAASIGNGCRINGRRISVSTTVSLLEASFLCWDYSFFMRKNPREAEQILKTCRFAPGWGDALGYMLVAQGRCDLILDPGLSLWDAAPIKVCIEEAGGCFTDWNGKASIYIENAVAANPVLHSEVLKILGKGGQ